MLVPHITALTAQSHDGLPHLPEEAGLLNKPGHQTRLLGRTHYRHTPHWANKRRAPSQQMLLLVHSGPWWIFTTCVMPTLTYGMVVDDTCVSLPRLKCAFANGCIHKLKIGTKNSRLLSLETYIQFYCTEERALTAIVCSPNSEI